MPQIFSFQSLNSEFWFSSMQTEYAQVLDCGTVPSFAKALSLKKNLLFSRPVWSWFMCGMCWAVDIVRATSLCYQDVSSEMEDDLELAILHTSL